MHFFLSLVLMVVFVSQAYAGVFGDILKGTAEVLLNTTSSQEEQLSSQGKQEEARGDQQVLLEQDNRDDQKKDLEASVVGKSTDLIDYVKVDKGSYGIPLGATMDTFLEWCKEKGVSIAMQSVVEFQDQLKRTVSNARMDENLAIEDLEKEVNAKLAGGGLDTFEVMKILRIKEMVNILKGPRINYSDKQYPMVPVFLNEAQTTNGVAYSVPDEDFERICSAPGLTNDTYIVSLEPSKEMLDSGISAMMLFVIQKDQELKTYAVLTEYFYRNTLKQQNQWALTKDTLTKKYQIPVVVNVVKTSYGMNSKEYEMKEKLSNAIREPLNQDAFYLFGQFSYNIAKQTFYMFGRNIVLTLGDPGRPYYLFYVEADLAKELLPIKVAAMQSCRDQAIVGRDQKTKNFADNL